jgi:3,4-dihydroxy-2-butanone 4-phosphate synthase
MGYFAEPETSFQFYVNDRKLIDGISITDQSTTWQNAEKTADLHYERDDSRPEMGRFTLELPAEMVTPGQSLRLKIIGSESNSRRWMGVWETSCEAP